MYFEFTLNVQKYDVSPLLRPVRSYRLRPVRSGLTRLGRYRSSKIQTGSISGTRTIIPYFTMKDTPDYTYILPTS